VEQFLFNKPKVFTIGLVWETNLPSPSDINEVLHLLDQTINLKIMFSFSTQEDSWYQIKGIICYYGKHYDAYFYNEPTNKWWVFDDATVKEVGDTWEEVKERCLKGHFQPCILFYEQVRN